MPVILLGGADRSALAVRSHVGEHINRNATVSKGDTTHFIRRSGQGEKEMVIDLAELPLVVPSTIKPPKGRDDLHKRRRHWYYCLKIKGGDTTLQPRRRTIRKRAESTLRRGKIKKRPRAFRKG
jgi:hypothetical protein